MVLFESLLVIMFAAVILAAASRRVGIPYPVVLAIGGTALAFVPNAPRITLDPELVLALFVAPILLDAAFDSSPRDLRRNWLPVSSLVFVAVGVTTAAVALVTRWLVPDIPWPPRSRSGRSSRRPTPLPPRRSCESCGHPIASS